MTLDQHIRLMDAQYVEYYFGLEVIPTSHPPSLTVPRRVPQDTAQDGWHKGDTRRKKKQARQDLKVIMQRIQRQEGKPVMIRHAMMNPQSIYSPAPYF